MQVTVDLDVLVRQDLLNFLKEDSEKRGATILCKSRCQVIGGLKIYACSFTDATHIFDGLNDFPTHVAHMRFGSFVTLPTSWDLSKTSTTLYHVALE